MAVLCGDEGVVDVDGVLSKRWLQHHYVQVVILHTQVAAGQEHQNAKQSIALEKWKAVCVHYSTSKK